MCVECDIAFAAQGNHCLDPTSAVVPAVSLTIANTWNGRQMCYRIDFLVTKTPRDSYPIVSTCQVYNPVVGVDDNVSIFATETEEGKDEGEGVGAEEGAKCRDRSGGWLWMEQKLPDRKHELSPRTKMKKREITERRYFLYIVLDFFLWEAAKAP